MGATVNGLGWAVRNGTAYLAVGSTGGIYLFSFDGTTLTLTFSIDLGTDPIDDAELSSNGQLLAACNSGTEVLQLYRFDPSVTA
jgi:hypothetical protein